MGAQMPPSNRVIDAATEVEDGPVAGDSFEALALGPLRVGMIDLEDAHRRCEIRAPQREPAGGGAGHYELACH